MHLLFIASTLTRINALTKSNFRHVTRNLKLYYGKLQIFIKL
jgi:hypothetical protein